MKDELIKRATENIRETSELDSELREFFIEQNLKGNLKYKSIKYGWNKADINSNLQKRKIYRLDYDRFKKSETTNKPFDPADYPLPGNQTAAPDSVSMPPNSVTVDPEISLQTVIEAAAPDAIKEVFRPVDPSAFTVYEIRNHYREAIQIKPDNVQAIFEFLNNKQIRKNIERFNIVTKQTGQLKIIEIIYSERHLTTFARPGDWLVIIPSLHKVRDFRIKSISDEMFNHLYKAVE